MNIHILQQILDRDKIKWGTPEYWEKERKSKFRRNARKIEEEYRNSARYIIDLYALKASEIPLIHLESLMKPIDTGYNPETGTWTWKIPTK